MSYATHIIDETADPAVALTVQQIIVSAGAWDTTNADRIESDRGIRPGLFDETNSPPVGTIVESVNDGHLYWIHRDGTVHQLCSDGSGY